MTPEDFLKLTPEERDRLDNETVEHVLAARSSQILRKLFPEMFHPLEGQELSELSWDARGYIGVFCGQDSDSECPPSRSISLQDCSIAEG